MYATNSSSRGRGGGRGGFIIVAPPLKVSCCETTGASSESERIIGSSRVQEANIRDRVIAEVSSQVSVWLGTSGGSSGPIQGNFSRVLQVPR